MTGKTKTSAWMTLLVGGVLWAGLGTHLQARQDPLRIIFVQAKEKPAVYILLDTSGSMNWPAVVEGCRLCVGTHCAAECPLSSPAGTPKVSIVEDFGQNTGGDPSNGTGHGYWVRVRKQGDSFSYWFFVPPSRMAMVKNLFGNCITIYDVANTLKQAPLCSDSSSDSTRPCRSGPPAQWRTTYYRFPFSGGPINGAFFQFEYNSQGSLTSKGWVNYTPGSPNEPIPDPAWTVTRPPVDIVQQNINTVYWGMGHFTGNIARDNRSTRDVPLLPADNNNNNTVQPIHNRMGPAPGAPAGGRCPGSGLSAGSRPESPTSGGLNFVKGELDQFFAQDTRGNTCQRPYFAILITDGESNICNPNDTEWPNFCQGYTNSATLVRYPPGRTDELFRNLALDPVTSCKSNNDQDKHSPRGPSVQTFVIGISPDVSRCELNLTAFCGRTDASADDAGVNWQTNPRAPAGDVNVSCSDSLSTRYKAPPACDPATDSNCKDYAFFADNPQQLQDAFNKILASILAGDYSTALPVTSIEARGTAFQNAVFIPSTKIPGWKGTLRRWEVAPCGDNVSPATHVDVSNLTFDQLCNVLKQQNPRIIVTSGTTTCVSPDPNDPRNTFHFHLKWDAACSLLDQANPSQNDYNRRIYTVDPGCAVGNAATGPTVACRTLKMFRKDSTTVAWVRSKFGGVVDWSQLDFNGNGQTADTDDQDVRMLIDFILGGDGQGNKRAWLMGDVIGSSTQVVATPLTYALKTVPPKDAFDQQFRNRPVIAYVAANDGLLHAFRADHDPSDPASPPIELFAFLPPQAFPDVVKMFQNFLKNPKIPTGQAEPPNFDQHIWTMAAPLNSADIWIRWRDSTLGTPGWRTVLYVPMGPTIPGLYALDVTDPSRLDPNNPEARPPFQVLWYWTAPPGSYGDKVWNAVPLGPSRETRISPKLQNQYLTLWIVGVVTTDSADTHVHSLTSLLAADTGETVKGGRVIASPVNCDPAGTDDRGRLNPFCVPYHVYGHEAFVSSEVDLSAADMPNTHTFVPDTAGRVFVENIFPENALLWRDNNPTPLNLPFTQPPTDPKKNPIYFTPSVVHARGKQALMLATVTGSIFETDSDVNDNSNPQCCEGRCTIQCRQDSDCFTGQTCRGGQCQPILRPPCFCDAGGNGFCTKIMLDIFDVDPNTRDIQQTNPSTQHFELRIGNTSFQVDTDGDGDVDGTVTLSPLTRATTRPLVVMDAATGGGGPTSGRAYFLLMDPGQTQGGLCVGRTYLVPVPFAFTTGGGGGGGGSFVRFASPPQVQQPIQQLGFGPVTSITAVAGKLVVVQAGYGARIAAPAVPGPPAPNSTPTLPLLRGVRRVQ